MSWFCPGCLARFEDPPPRCPNDDWAPVEDLSGWELGGRYTLQRLIGVGGMGSTVWRAKQNTVDRTVAIKLLPPTGSTPGQRFTREAKIASNLNHPHIVTIHDYGEADDGKLYLVMEHLAGHTLQAELKKNPVIAPERALKLVDHTLRALEHAHGKHVVHRDLKPGNLFLTVTNDDRDYLKVLDFGLARYIEGAIGEDDESPAGADMDVTGQRQVVCGTPNYMAPEQLLCGKIDARTDVYAVGVVMYRMLTGQLPFTADTSYDLYRQIIGKPAAPFASVRAGLEVTPAVEAFVMKALSKTPADRFASAREMRVAMREVRHGLGVFSQDRDDVVLYGHPTPAPIELFPTPSPSPGTEPSASREPRGRRWGYLVALAAAVPALAVGAWLVPRWLSRSGADAPAAVTSPAPGATVLSAAPAPRHVLDPDPPELPPAPAPLAPARQALREAETEALGTRDRGAIVVATAEVAPAALEPVAVEPVVAPPVAPVVAPEVVKPRVVVVRPGHRATEKPAEPKVTPPAAIAAPTAAPTRVQIHTLDDDKERSITVGKTPVGAPTALEPKAPTTAPKVDLLDDDAPRKDKAPASPEGKAPAPKGKVDTLGE